VGQGGEWSRVEREGEEWASISASKNRDLKKKLHSATITCPGITVVLMNEAQP